MEKHGEQGTAFPMISNSMGKLREHGNPFFHELKQDNKKSMRSVGSTCSCLCITYCEKTDYIIIEDRSDHYFILVRKKGKHRKHAIFQNSYAYNSNNILILNSGHKLFSSTIPSPQIEGVFCNVLNSSCKFFWKTV